MPKLAALSIRDPSSVRTSPKRPLGFVRRMDAINVFHRHQKT